MGWRCGNERLLPPTSWILLPPSVSLPHCVRFMQCSGCRQPTNQPPRSVFHVPYNVIIPIFPAVRSFTSFFFETLKRDPRQHGGYVPVKRYGEKALVSGSVYLFICAYPTHSSLGYEVPCLPRPLSSLPSMSDIAQPPVKHLWYPRSSHR